MCRSGGRLWGHYYENLATKRFLQALESNIGIPILDLLQSQVGGDHAGTWVHPRVAVHLGQWLSNDFAVAVTGWVMEWAQSHNAIQDRYLLNRVRIQRGYFSALNETYNDFIGILEQMGYKLPEWHDYPDGHPHRHTPDVSVGRIWNDYLRAEGENPDSFPNYIHSYTDERGEWEVRVYPLRLYPLFKWWLVTHWLPNAGRRYLLERVPDALDFFDRMLELPAYRQSDNYLTDGIVRLSGAGI